MTSLQFGPEWMRKAPSKNPSLSKEASSTSEANGHASATSDVSSATLSRPAPSKRQPSLGSLGAPSPVTAVPARSPGAFSFAAAAAAAGDRASGGGTSAQSPSLLADEDRRYSRERLLSLYSGDKNGKPSEPTSDTANGTAPASAANTQKRKNLFATDNARRSENSGPLSPALPSGGTEPRGLNSRGVVPDKERSGGLFQRGGGGANSGGSLVSPTLSRERFGGGIQGGVLSGVAPASRKSRDGDALPESPRDELGSWSRHGSASMPEAFQSSSRLRNKAGEGGIGSLGNGGPELGISEAARQRLRQRAAGQGPIGPPADGSTGFTRRDRNAPSGYVDGGVAPAPEPANNVDEQQHVAEHENGNLSAKSSVEAALDQSVGVEALRIDDSSQPSHETHTASQQQQPPPPPQDDHLVHELPKWYYRDEAGTEQGPFESKSMQSWYSGGFFPDHLPIRPETQPNFESLGSYIARVGSRAELFLAPYVPEVPSPFPLTNSLGGSLPHGNAYNLGQPSFDHGIPHSFSGGSLRGLGQDQFGMGGGWGGANPNAWPGGIDLGFDGQKAGMSPSLFGAPQSPFGNPAFGNGGLPIEVQIRQQEELAALLRQRQLNDQGSFRGPGWDSPAVPTPWEQYQQHQQFDTHGQQLHQQFPSHLQQQPQLDQQHSQQPQSLWHQEQSQSTQSDQQSSAWASSQVTLPTSQDEPVHSVRVAEPIGTPRRSRSPAPAPQEPPAEQPVEPEREAEPVAHQPEQVMEAESNVVEPEQDVEPVVEKPESPAPQPRTLVEAAAPEQLWPQSPSAVEFASEPSLPEVPPMTLSDEREASVRSRRKRTKGRVDVNDGADSSSPSAATSSSGYGNVRVVSEEMARRGAPAPSSSSVSVPIAAWLPDAPATPATPSSKPAPWAEEKANSSGSTLSLREIQEAEARQAEARRSAERAALAAQRKATAAASPLSKDTLPTTMSWGLASQPSTAAKMSSPVTTTPSSAVWNANATAPKKTLMEIQEEEKLRAQRAREAVALAGVRKAYADSASRQTAGLSITTNGTANPGGGWSVVGSSGKPNTPTVPPAAAARAATPQRSASATVSSPSVWSAAATRPNGASTPTRSASATVKPSKSAVADAASTQPSPEFLRYCREQLKGLNVKIDDFVEMLLSFPLEPSPDVVEIIAESVYANSSTLDGRRFAADFVAKRKMDVGIGGKAGGDFSSSLGAGAAGWNQAKVGKETKTASEVVKAAAQNKAAESFGGFKVVKKGGKRK